MSEKHTLSVLVENKPGVLTRVSALFTRRGFNIHSLAVGPTEHEDISRITVIADAEGLAMEQVTKQLNKLVNVLKIVELDPDTSVERELYLIKVHADDANRTAVLQVVDLFRAHVVDVAPTPGSPPPVPAPWGTACPPPWVPRRPAPTVRCGSSTETAASR